MSDQNEKEKTDLGLQQEDHNLLNKPPRATSYEEDLAQYLELIE